MTQLLVNSVDHFFRAEWRRSCTQCPECGSFLDSPRLNPETGEVARKCVACQKWHVKA